MAALLFLAHIQVGRPPNLNMALLVAGIFIGGEFVAVRVGFDILGG